jgi:hypothetical protein
LTSTSDSTLDLPDTASATRASTSDGLSSLVTTSSRPLSATPILTSTLTSVLKRKI